MRHNKRTVLTMPTGSGKTRTGSVISLMAMDKGNQIDVLVHREELLEQFHETLLLLGHDAEVCTSTNKNINWDAPIIIGMVETYNKRIKIHDRKPKMIMVDEAHRGEFRKILHDYDGYVLGLSATPIASAKDKPLNDYFSACINPIKQSWLIEQKKLCQCEYFTTAFNGKNLKKVGGEFTERSQMVEFSKPKLYKGVLRQYQLHSSGEKAICYNVNVEHSLEMHKQFTDAGIKSWHVDGKTPKDERKRILKEFYDYVGGCVLHNVGIATTGTDIPSVQTIILNRSTTQISLYHQMVGRGGRVVQGSKYSFKVLDMGGNTDRFKNVGVYGHDVDWQELFNNPSGGFDGREAKIQKKSCPQCAKTLEGNARKCPCCKYEFTKKQLISFAELSRDLTLKREIIREYLPDDLKIPTGAMNYSQLQRYAAYFGYSPKWASIQMGIRKTRQETKSFPHPRFKF